MNIEEKKKRNPISYSVWFIPEGNKYDILHSLIINISKKYTYIEFMPHVTLLGGFLGEENDLKNKTKNLAKKIAPLTIKFNEIAILNEFFRCLFFKIKTNHIFNHARSLAVDTFLYEDYDFLPHLSLAYGSENEKIKTEIKLFVENNLKNVNNFYADTLYLVKNDEIRFQWEIIEEYKLN
jgi:2'-5' RNA ligase